VLVEAILKSAGATTQQRKRIEHEWIAREQRDGVADASTQSVGARAR